MLDKSYFYIVNYPIYEKELCEMEMKYLFGITLTKKCFFINKDICPSRSPFIKERIKIIYNEESLEEIIRNIINEKLSYEDFKISFIKLEDTDINYKERLNSIRELGLVITGESEMHNPKVNLALTKVNGRWIFGEYQRNDYKWHIHDEKPHNYSNSLGIRVARALVNIAVGQEIDKKVVDPGCGVGTVVIEALSMGIKANGYEIRETIAENARRNLEFFGYDKSVINHGDMHKIKKHYDVAIVDLPYGLFTPVTLEEQKEIIKTARRIADRIVIVTFEDMREYIKQAGFEIVDSCTVCKGNFKRYIDICS